MAILGEKVRKQREKMGMTRYRLAKASGVDAASIHRIEDGQQLNIQTPTAEKLARALKILPSELLGIK